MGFRFQKRMKLRYGAGLNLSKSGVSSYRGKYGSIGSGRLLQKSLCMRVDQNDYSKGYWKLFRTSPIWLI